MVQGRLKSRQYETREGEKRTVFEIDVDEIGPSLKNATAKITKANRSGGGGGGSGWSGDGGGSAGAASGGGSFGGGSSNDPWASSGTAPSGSPGAVGNDPWASNSGGSVEDPPF